MIVVGHLMGSCLRNINQKILQENTMPSGERLCDQNFIFQEGNDHKYSSCLCGTYLMSLEHTNKPLYLGVTILDLQALLLENTIESGHKEQYFEKSDKQQVEFEAQRPQKHGYGTVLFPRRIRMPCQDRRTLTWST
ncbi:hypothetical protein Trydic_g7453 [Trypoxylus dichotomus]